MSQEWLENLKQGDEVIFEYDRPNARVEKVERATKTQLQVAGYRFQRATGRCKTSKWHSIYLREATEEAKGAIANKEKREALVDYIERMVSGNRLWSLKTGDLDELATHISRMTMTERPQ